MLRVFDDLDYLNHMRKMYYKRDAVCIVRSVECQSYILTCSKFIMYTFYYFFIYTVESLERESECECASQQVNTSLLFLCFFITIRQQV